MSLYRAVELAGPIPADTAKQSEKKAYSELLSRELAFEIADTLREEPIFRNISPRRPKNDEPAKQPNAKLKRLKQESPEKYFLGGFGRKKLDVSLAHEQDGLLLAVSVKTITSRDARTRNYNKNFKNRFGDLCAEATSVHMRSPYTVMCGIFAMPAAAAFDDTSKRRSTASRAMKIPTQHFRAGVARAVAGTFRIPCFCPVRTVRARGRCSEGQRSRSRERFKQ